MKSRERRQGITLVTGITKPIAEAFAAMALLGMPATMTPQQLSLPILVLLAICPTVLFKLFQMLFGLFRLVQGQIQLTDIFVRADMLAVQLKRFFIGTQGFIVKTGFSLAEWGVCFVLVRAGSAGVVSHIAH